MTIATATPSTTSRRTKKATTKTDSAKVESTTLDAAAAEVEADEQLAGVRGASVDQVGDYLRHIGRLALLTAEEEADILDAYNRAWRRGGSPVRLMAVLEQFEFLEDVLAQDGASPNPAVSAVRRLREALEARFMEVGHDR